MSQISVSALRGLSETLLLPLYYRAAESSRPDALVRDERAAEIVSRLDYDFSRLAGVDSQQLFAILRTRQIDQWTRDFLARHPRGVVVDLGCGLDTRFWRVDNGQVEWFDLDLPAVMAVRRQVLEDGPRCHAIASSMLDFAWMDTVRQAAGRPFLLLAEGVFPYLEEREVRQLVLAARDCLGGAELVFDAMSAQAMRLHNLQLAVSRLTARLHWGFSQSRDLEDWGPGIHLTGEWSYFDRPEPRLGWMSVLAKFPPIGKANLVLRYEIGSQKAVNAERMGEPGGALRASV